MNPIHITEKLRESMIRYLLTTFDVNRDGQEPALYAALRESFSADGSLFNGPFLELTLPYLTGANLEELANQGVIERKLLQLDCFKKGKPIWPDTELFVHQESAIRKLCTENRNVVVSSGTGSGKTECFLIPILNDLLKDPSPGVRAVIIYPLNALVNDQLERLRDLLSGTEITFGRYTGELPQSKREALKTMDKEPLPNEVICRDDIQKEGKIPQILITNYAMLEYLLLRPADAPLFGGGSWRFIVLDEAHTHAGAQGIEIGLLVRRLRHRLRLASDDTRCIATSATLTDDKADEAAIFAEALFGVPFREEDVIFGQVKKDDKKNDINVNIQPDIYLQEKMSELINVVRRPNPSTMEIALLMEEIGLTTADAFDLVDKYETKPTAFLWHILRSNPELLALNEFMANYGNPIAVEEAAREVFGTRLPEEERVHALFHLIELGALAREDEDSLPLLPAKYHLFARPPQGIWVCLNSSCSGRQHNTKNGWSRVFANRREKCDSCGKSVYPLYVCRTCGQSYIRGMVEGGHIYSEADPILDPEQQYFSWRPINENPSLSDNEDISELENSDTIAESFNKFSQIEFRLCLNCQKPVPTCNCDASETSHVILYRIVEIESTSKGVRNIPVNQLNECPRCRDKAFGETEIATPVSLYSTTPLSILTNELYRQLPTSIDPDISNKPGGGRKLLSFYDSRQGAARFAAFLQDTVNDQIYRHIIPEAVRQLEHEKGRLPDLEEVADRCFKIAWNYRIFHNDPDYSDDLINTRRPSRPQRDRFKLKFMEQAIAEFTTRRRGRQSLEALGLIAIEYFEPDYEPDFNLLASNIGLDVVKARTLVEYLLDGLRNQKIVVLPEGVMRDSEVFGRNKFSRRLVRSKAQQYEEAWIGETERQHRRQFVKQVLQKEGLPEDDDNQKTVLNSILTWLRDETELLDGSASEGFQLAYNRLFLSTTRQWYQCDQCHRFSPRGNGGLICPHHTCQGILSSTDIENILSDNFYRRIFDRELIPMRVEEHTAQLESRKGRRYQNDFKRGNINVLSCSTTFEMGIDLGDLQGIVLSNIPPSVSNYKQRAGRAGRRTSGTAFILAFASDRPHDQTYFTAPEGIINGHVRVPHITTQNEFILQRHINAILFSSYMRFRKSEGFEDLLRVGPFFDAQVVDQPHYDGMELWLTTQLANIDTLLTTFINYLDGEQYNINNWKAQFKSTFSRRGSLHYSDVAGYYVQEIQVAATKMAVSYSDELSDTSRRYGKLLERLRGEYLINYLSDRGILPSYSFPLHTVELMIHPDKARGLRLQRDVRQAIREYAPGQEIVADKRIWKSIGLAFYRETPQLFHYRICESCNHLQIGMEAGIPVASVNDPCPVCKEPPSNRKKNIFRYLEPDGFRSSKDSGIPARQYVKREPNLMRTALIPIEPDDIQLFGEILEGGYSREGKLLYVNEGNFGLGFKICQKCGTRVSHKRIKCPGKYHGEPCKGQLDVVSLGFQEITDTLRLTFHPTPGLSVPNQYDKSFWISLMYALIHGASQALQIERRDIDGVLFPKQTEENTWQQTIVLYDDVPGGAGHVRQIREEIIKVTREALRIVNCVDCAPDSSCYHCLRDYNNQYDHHILTRGPVAKFLEALLASLLSSGDPSQPNPVVALNYPRWLMQTVGRAQHKVTIVADGVSLDSPSGELYHWLDILIHLLKRDVQVILRLTKEFRVTIEEPETLSIARYLHLMIDNGLQLDRIETIPEWRMLIDPDSVDSARALRPTTDDFFLDELCGHRGLETLTSFSLVSDISQELERIPGKPLENDALTPPNNISVINIDSSLDKISEEELFKSVFDLPVVRFQINDRYLYDQYRIVERLGKYIQMAWSGGKLEKVFVYTWDADRIHSNKASRDAQNRAIAQIKSKFPKINIEFKRTNQVDHDRYIILERDNGTFARIILGKGLDFINSDGTVERTYIVIEDPYFP